MFLCPKFLVLDPNVRHRHYVVAKSERPGRRYPKWNRPKMASTQQSSDSNYQLFTISKWVYIPALSPVFVSAKETNPNSPRKTGKHRTNTTNTPNKQPWSRSFSSREVHIFGTFFSQSLRQPVNHQRPDVNPWVPFPHRLPGRPHPFQGSNGAGGSEFSNTLPETNSLHPKMDGWKMKFPFGMAYFQGQTVSFREGNQQINGSMRAGWCEPKPPNLLWPDLLSSDLFLREIGGKDPITWRIIPFTKWLITMVSKSPNWGCSFYKWLAYTLWLLPTY